MEPRFATCQKLSFLYVSQEVKKEHNTFTRFLQWSGFFNKCSNVYFKTIRVMVLNLQKNESTSGWYFWSAFGIFWQYIFFDRFDRSETTTMTLERNGLFDVSVHKILMESDLQPETIFECLLTIPGTSFSAKADSMYLKGQGKETTQQQHQLAKVSCSNYVL